MTLRQVWKPGSTIYKLLPWLSLIVVLIISVLLRGRYLWVEAFSYDEGHWLMFGALANKGYTAYSVTFVGIPPLALLAIQLGAKLFGITLAARYPMMLISLLGIAAIYLSFRPWKSRVALLAGLLAAIILSADVDYFHGSGTIMAEVPAVALALISFVLARQYTNDHCLFWLVLSGVAFALSLAFKLFMVFLPALAGLLILFVVWPKNKETWGASLLKFSVAGGVWAVGAIIPWIVFLIIYDSQAMIEQIFLFRLAFRDVNLYEGSTVLNNLNGVGQMLMKRLPLVIGAILGLFVGWRHRQFGVWSWGLWFVLALLPLVWQAPLRERYSVMLLPPLAALSSIAIAISLKQVAQWLQQKNASRLIQPIIAVLLLGFVVLSLTVPVKSAYLPPTPDTFADLNLAAVQYVWEHTTPNDCIVTDDQRFAFAANRLVPAELSETAIGRLAVGWVTADTIVEQLELHNCPMVIYADWRFFNYLPDLYHKLSDLYFVELPFGDDILVFAGKKHVSRQPQIPLDVKWGDEIALNGIDLTPMPWRSGQQIRLATYWTAIKPPKQVYKIFLQLRDQQNEPVANFDHFPFPLPDGKIKAVPHIENPEKFSDQAIAAYPTQGLVPTFAWPVNQTIREVIPIQLPPNIPPGTYNLFIGLYEPDSLARLPVKRSQTAEEFLLAEVVIVDN